MSTFDTIREMIVDQFQLDPTLVTPEATLKSLNIDSLATVEFMFLIEAKFNIDALKGQAELHTVQDLVDEIDRLVAEHHRAQRTKKDAA